MKKILLLILPVFLLGTAPLLKAQCYGVVHYDQSSTANGLSNFTITTSYCNELILIAYNGWFGPGTGPVTVDGFPATSINISHTSNSACAEAYCYFAPTAGVHNIVCTETGYNLFNPPNYILNFASSFYVTGTSTPLSCSNVATVETAVGFGNSVNQPITTTTPNEVIFGSFVYNTGIFNPYAIVVTGSTVTETLHVGDGIDAAEGYTIASTIGTYNVNTSDVNSCCGGGTVLVAIVPPLCTGGAGGMRAVASQINPTCGNCNGSISIVDTGGVSPYTYLWSPNISSTNVATGLCGGNDTVKILDSGCPQHDTTIIITLPFNNLNIATNITSNEKCNGDCIGSVTASITGGVSPYTYSWTPGGGSTATVNNLCAGTYTISIQDVNGCSGTAKVTITQPAILTVATAVTNVLCNGGTGSATAAPSGGTGPYSYIWSSNPAQTTTTASGLSAGTYTVTVTDFNACTASAFATISQPAPLVVNLSGPAIICMGDTGTLAANASGGTSPYGYTWAGPGIIPAGSTAKIPPATQTYTVNIVDANGCTASASLTVNLGPNMTVTINGPASICKGLSTTLCANVIGGTGGNIYTWQPGNLATPCITVNPLGTTTYTLTVYDNCGTTATTIKTLNVKPLPATAFATNLSRGCAPLCIQFYNTTTLAQGSASSYVWTFGNGDSSSAQNPIYCFPLSGSYNIGLTVVSDSGCSSTLNKVGMITAYARPSTAFTYSPNPASILDPTIQFTDKSTDQYNIIYWLWSFGDISDSSSNLENPTHTYQDTGSYCVNMVAMDEHGCTDTAINCLIIEPNFNLYIPSAFTPNGDNRNQTFEPKGDYIKTFEMYIFDRWGMLLYHTTDISKGWDGTVGGGSIAQEDTYVYKILITDTRKKQHTYVGNVTLLK